MWGSCVVVWWLDQVGPDGPGLGVVGWRIDLLTGLDHSEILTENLSVAATRPDDMILYELTHLALTQDELTFLAAELFDLLRKISGQPMAVEYLGGIQYLAATGTVAGVRLLAAFLNVAAPGDRLVPLVCELDSSRRYAAQLLHGGFKPSPLQTDWQRRLLRVVRSAAALENIDKATIPSDVCPNPRDAEPWPLLRGIFGDYLSRAQQEEFWTDKAAAAFLADLLRLEVDAWQERISGLAGNINPFRVESVARVLPLLNRADSEIRDLRQMVAWVAESDYESAFVLPQARWRETLDEKDWGHLLRDLQSHPGLVGLARLAQGLAARPIMLPQLAEGVRRITELSAALVDSGVRDTPLDLLTACVLAQSHYGHGQVVFAVEKEVAEAVAAVLPHAQVRDHPLRGISLLAGLLIIELNNDPPSLPHGLPVMRESTEDEERGLLTWRVKHRKIDAASLEVLREQGLALIFEQESEVPEDEPVEVEDLGASALKHLVMTNLQSVSVLLGFLRNPKIISIPGLVEEVANRTRNPQIIATIASDRALHTGFANKGVALACLRSPVNVSVKTLRKFCHVKYVSKIELKRMASDRTGVRKEVAREIAKYLEALT